MGSLVLKFSICIYKIAVEDSFQLASYSARSCFRITVALYVCAYPHSSTNRPLQRGYIPFGELIRQDEVRSQGYQSYVLFIHLRPYYA